jgi:small GTP-binding protein
MSDSNSNQFYVPGGTLTPDAPSYIERKTDRELYEHLRAGDFCYVLTSRQMGKSSLMARVALRLKEEKQASVAILDLTQLGAEQGKADAARWYYGIAHQIQRELQISCNLQSWWRGREDLLPVHRLSEFFSDVVLARTSCPVVIFIDEIDSTIGLPFAGDFFATIRACYNQRAIKQQFQRLTFVLLGVARPSDLIPDLRRTPFNIGHRIELEDFTFGEALPLAKELPGKTADRKRLLRRVLSWTNGHPYLTQKTLAELVAQNPSEVNERAVSNIVHKVFIDPPTHQTDVHISTIRDFLNGQGAILKDIKATYRLVLLDQERVDDDPLSPVKSALKLSGLLKVGEDGQLVVRNRIYQRTFADWEAGDTFYKIDESQPASTQKSDLANAVSFTTAKVLLLGDSGVGKSGLGWRLSHDEFKDQVSSHGQQLWVLDQLGTRRADGTECEAILWDLAGQSDYRLIHSLFMDDADLALLVFDPTDRLDPLRGVEFWLEKLRAQRESLSQTARKKCPVILVAARADRGAPALTQDELDDFCRQRGINGTVSLSALTGQGLNQLVQQMKTLISWEDKAATVTTATFKRIKDYILNLKEDLSERQLIVQPDIFRRELERTDANWEFSDAEMMTAIGHMENYGYVRLLRTSKGEERILLAPELLNNLASSFVLEARRNPLGLGALEEQLLMAGRYSFPELENLPADERDILLDAATLLFLKHNICFRETDPFGGKVYLVFPALINLKKPLLEDEETEDGTAYIVRGVVENVYASLVVLFGYTHVFTRTNQWRNQARYEVGDGLICGFRLDAESEGELNLVLYFGTNVGQPVRTLFRGLFESFLARRNLNVLRYEPVVCPNGHTINREVVRFRLSQGRMFAFCHECGARVTLSKADDPVQLTQAERRKVEEQSWAAARRSRFEQAVFQLVSYVESQKLPRPKCFISYAWGHPEHERWVERNLATDLQKAGINVVLDKWESASPGMSVPRFVSRIADSDMMIVVGTPLYLEKFENNDSSTGSVVASEVDIISQRLLSTVEEKETVLPILLAGDINSSLPRLLRGRVYADFRNERSYFTRAFDLILSIYKISPVARAVTDLRESLRESEMR